MKKNQTSLFIFRRDLRLHDNTGLIEALRTSEQVIPCFILEPRYFQKSRSYFCKTRLDFLYDCLNDLEEELKSKNSHLYTFWGNYEKILSKLTKLVKIDSIFVNRDYTPASKKRDLKIKKFCKKRNIEFIEADDLLLHDVDKILTQQGKPYKVFTQFFNTAKVLPVRSPQKNNHSNFYTKKISLELKNSRFQNLFGKDKKKKTFPGGRKACKKLLSNLKSFKKYDNERNFPSLDATTRLSSHNRFGTYSIREIYNKVAKELGKNHTLISELHWRDFFSYVLYHYPHSFSKNFRSNYDKLPWNKSKKEFNKWCQGMTGFPIVDAGMRQLNQTGFMHNRVRMIVASFLTKDLHIDWKWGERYFASKLVDYDPSVNVGNWQWSASTGCDSQPWFRIFNPWLQQEKFDPNCTYIKKWIPELSDLSSEIIHKWHDDFRHKSYPRPILDHKEEANLTKEMFKKFSKRK